MRIEVDGRTEIETIPAKSRTFIPARLKNNPHLYADGEYLRVVNSMPEPMRTALLTGDFSSVQQPDPYQIIPTAWVRAAQKRWLEMERPAGRPDAAGHDVARGGKDNTVFVERWGVYIGNLQITTGFSTPDGPAAADFVHRNNHDPEYINTDVIGYGSASHDALKGLGYKSKAINVSHTSTYTDRSGKLRMFNLRTELLWRMRDALDPDHGVGLALPPGKEVIADLCSVRYQPMAGGKVKAESKDDVKKRIGRSPDVGDAILLANYDTGGGYSEVVHPEPVIGRGRGRRRRVR